ncbi:hypothetical protein ANRL2_03881 [Anaerolineae bacterium]|nr:hypothetical protein ANRL2_03881 [Anaerolineae bacterium]
MITPAVPGHKPASLASNGSGGRANSTNSLVILLHSMDIVAPNHHWRGTLKNLIAQHGIDVSAMDFPGDWQTLPIWREQP